MAITDKELLQENDYVVLLSKQDGVEANSVGLVKSIPEENLYEVFFVGKQKQISIKRSEIAFIDISKTGKPHKYKICNVCHILKDYYEDFEINQTDAQGRKTTRPSCRECRKNIDGTSLRPEERIKLNDIKPKGFLSVQFVKKDQYQV